MTSPRRADARRGFLFASIRSPRTRWQGWQGWTCCGMLDSMLQYNRPRRRDEVADFVAASGRRLYLFAAVRLALCSRLPISISLPSAQARAPADTGAQAFSARRQAQRMQREHAGHEQRAQASPCADVRGGWGGAYDIGRDGTSSGGRAQAHSCGRTRRADVRRAHSQ